MKLFPTMYQKMLTLGQHRHAPKYLAGISIAESSFFPIPVDVILAPMVLAKPQRWWKLALLTTSMSVVGGIIGFFIGVYFLDLITPLLQKYHYWENFINIKSWFEEWGIWFVFVLGFSPLPYKVATIAAGSFGMALLPFILASFIARGLRFFLVAFVVKISATKIQSLDLVWIERIGWITVLILATTIGIKWLN